MSITERDLDYAHVTDVRSPALRSTFIRLVRRGEAEPLTTFDAEATVDVDADGRIIGVTVHQFTEDGEIH